MKTLSTGCSDWMRGWGYGGYNHLGRMTLTEPVVENPGWFYFTWKGHSQGRHGGKWNKGAKLECISNGVEIHQLFQKGTVSEVRELLESINILIREYANNAAKQAKRDAKNKAWEHVERLDL